MPLPEEVEESQLAVPGPTILAVGELLVEFVSHQKGCGLETISGYTGPYPSGAPAIFLDQAALCGARTLLFGSVGNDGFGRALLGRLERDHVGTAAVSVHESSTTGTAFVSYNDDGSRNFIFHLTGTAADSLHFDETLLPDGDLVMHVSGSSLGPAPLRKAIVEAVDAVLRRGGRITCDPNARPELMRDEEGRRALDRIIAQSFCLLPSSSDLGFIFPSLDEQQAVEQLLQTSAEVVVVKRGDRGATLYAGGERHELPPYSVEEIDPTGAGDSFCGAFVALLTRGEAPLRAAQLANAAGALSVTRRGPMEGNSSLAGITAFAGRHVP